MKCNRFLISLIVILLFSFLSVFASNASVNTEDLDFTEIPEDLYEQKLTDFEFSVINQEPQKKKAIRCFAVSESGDIAILSAAFTRQTICIYTSEGEFKHGCQLSSHGAVWIDFSGDELLIYNVRSEVTFVLDETGEVTRIIRLDQTSKNDKYWYNSAEFTKEITVGDTTYFTQTTPKILSFLTDADSKLIARDSNGESRVIYDASGNHKRSLLISAIYPVSIMALGGIVAIIKYRDRWTL